MGYRSENWYEPFTEEEWKSMQELKKLERILGEEKPKTYDFGRAFAEMLKRAYPKKEASNG